MTWGSHPSLLQNGLSALDLHLLFIHPAGAGLYRVRIFTKPHDTIVRQQWGLVNVTDLGAMSYTSDFQP